MRNGPDPVWQETTSLVFRIYVRVLISSIQRISLALSLALSPPVAPASVPIYYVPETSQTRNCRALQRSTF